MPYQVVHAIAGRLRVRLPRLAADQDFALKLNQLVSALGFVTEVRINPAAHSLIVSYAASQQMAVAQAELFACIDRAAAVDLTLATDGVEGDDPAFDQPVEPEYEPQLNTWSDLALPAVSLGMALLAAPLEIPPLLIGAAIAGAALPWVVRATDSLVTHHHPNIDLLDSLWIGLQAAQGQYVAPALKTTLVEIRRSFRSEAQQQKQQHLLSDQNSPVWVERQGQSCFLPVSAIQVGDQIVVQPGDFIPVDGRVLQGAALLDTSPLTETTTAIACSVGDRVFASSQVLEGQLSILTERTGESTRMALVANLIKAAPIHDTEIGHRQAEFVKSAILPTLGLSGVIFALTGNLGAAISLYQLDFGSGVQISILTTLFSALTYAARQGIYIRSARILEHLAQLDTIVFDSSSLLRPTRQGYELRPETHSLLAELQAQNLQIYWTVDDADAIDVGWVATQLGLQPQQIYFAAGQPAQLVRGLQQQGKTVAFVADSSRLTDCPADIAVTCASAMAPIAGNADISLLDPNFQGLAPAIAISKRAMEVVYQNTAIIVVPNLLVQIGGGIFLGLNPVVNVITNNSSAFIAEFLHSARPLFEPNQPIGKSQPAANTPALRQNELAKRLQTTSQALTYHRSQPNFANWSQVRDPDRQAWIYEPKSRWFYAISTYVSNLLLPESGQNSSQVTAEAPSAV